MTKPFKSIEEQIWLLKNERGLIFLNENSAKTNLKHYGYYDIINGYKDPFLENREEDIYRDGTTFEQILALYELDKDIRYSALKAMLELESTLKIAVSYIIARDFGAQQKEYLKRENYNSGRIAGENKNGSGFYKIDQLLYKIDKISKDNTQPFKHYRENHSNIPPWIMVKGMSFGNIYNLYKLMKTPQKDSVIAMLYGIDEALISPDLKTLTSEFLYVCLKMRNRCAHSGRVYNYYSNLASIHYSPILHKSKMNVSEADFRRGFGKNGLWTILESLNLLDNKLPYIYLEAGMNYALKNFLKKYPDLEDFIIEEMKFKRGAFEKMLE